MILDGQLPASVAAAAQALQRGELLGLPTETVYGLAADATSDTAVARIFAAKGRPSDHPLIVHVADPAQAALFAQSVPAFAQALMQAFWPGPLTLILPRRPGVAASAAGGQDSVGLRCPSHPVAQAVLRAAALLGVAGVAAPSANQFGRVSPTTAQHVQDEFPADLMVLDGGACTVGIESTIVDCTRGRPVLLRPGRIDRDALESVCGPLALPQVLSQPDPRASGTLEAHYAPNAKVRLMDARAIQTALELLGQDAAHLALWVRSPLTGVAKGVRLEHMPDDPQLAAHQLFAVLRAFDAQAMRLIWVETPPDTPAWEGVRDRLQRAAAAG